MSHMFKLKKSPGCQRRRPIIFQKVLLLICLLSASYAATGQALQDLQYKPDDSTPADKAVFTDYQFNGYTNYWHDVYRKWYRYGSLFKIAVPDIDKIIPQSKVDVAEDMGLPGLILQEGFVEGLISGPFSILDQPSLQELDDALSKSNVLVFLDPGSETGQRVMSKLPSMEIPPAKLNSHQYGAADLKRIDAFVLENNERKLFAVSSGFPETRKTFGILADNTISLLKQFDLHKGWFGAETLLKSVTCTDGHPLEVIGAGMNEGNTWFVFSGYMDFLAKNELEDWMNRVNATVITDVGFSPIYGCKDYDGLQVQSMFTKESWIEYAHNKGGYVFRQVWDTLADPLHYDGYMVGNEGNKEHIDNEDVPFVLTTGRLDEDVLSSMVLFTPKGKALTRELMWEAILDRREVGILEQGKMMGPARYRNALQLLLLDKIYLENYFNDNIGLEVSLEGYDLQIYIRNSGNMMISGTLEITLPPELKLIGEASIPVDVPVGGGKSVHIALRPTAEAMNNTNPIAVHLDWDGKRKSTMTMLDMPPAISVHRILYGQTPTVSYPVTIHNFTDRSAFPVSLQVVDASNDRKVVFKTSQDCDAPPATFKDMVFDLDVPPGNYKVKVSALDVEYTSQLGVGKKTSGPSVYPLDLNSDGINEYRMENDSVQVTLLATGARVIEYIVKSRNDNVLFKLWPEKAIDDKRPFRKRGYYPYGGFEDFLGQGSMETHQVYDAEIVQDEGSFVRVRMWTDYFGNRLEKTFTLYGNSPLLEVRFALTFKNPEANVLGPQPILELGRRHWTEDVFVVPELDGLHEYRMMPEKYYGRIFFMKEGWSAGYDTKEDITYIGVFPVDQPLFLHMWQNHPVNNDAHHYYAEFQPWTPIYQKSTMYFTYYLYGMGGSWQNGVENLRKMNVISVR